MRQANHINRFWLYKMCELLALVGCLGKIGQEVIAAAMKSVVRDGSMRLGRGRAIALKKRGPFLTFGTESTECWPTKSESIAVNLLESEWGRWRCPRCPTTSPSRVLSCRLCLTGVTQKPGMERCDPAPTALRRAGWHGGAA